ncbi:hypothetical protein, partial [Mesorhizobium sp.]|uniref:hypothetical protein n=1 Tax=Mesorhizobium sp. TaxID=1871066 RepID=UPI00257F86D8
MIAEYWPLPPAAAAFGASARLFPPIDAVVAWSMRVLLRFTCRLETAFFAEAGLFTFTPAFSAFADAGFFTFTAAAFT